MSAHLFQSSSLLANRRIVSGSGARLYDDQGNSYLDASAGAMVVGLGHGDAEVLDALMEQSRAVAYVSRTSFVSGALEEYTNEVAALVPMPDAKIFTVSGGSEGVETAFKMARAYHVANGEPGRHKILSRNGEYHGATRGALDATDRPTYDRLYRPWLGQTVKLPRIYEYRCPFDETHPEGCVDRHVEEFRAAIEREGPETIACFVFEAVTGATTGVNHTTAEYWGRVQAIAGEHGILLVADEVMSGFGRTGRWFACQHWGIEPDLIVAGKGASSGYWPLAFVAVAGPVAEIINESELFVHGFTHSQSTTGAAVGLAVIRRLRELDVEPLVEARGVHFAEALGHALGDHPRVGDIRTLGLFAGVELVADRGTRAPFSRAARAAERTVSAGLDAGLYVYSSVGLADGTDGDLLLFGPPFVTPPEELEAMADLTRIALDRAFEN